MEFVMLGVGLLLTVGTGLFVASEFALVNLDRADLEARRDAGESRLSLTIDAFAHHFDPLVERTAGHHADHAPDRVHHGTGDLEPAASRLPGVGTARGADRLARRGHRRRRRHGALDDPGRAGPEEFRARHPAADREARHPVPGGLHRGVQARDRRAQRQRERCAARHGRRTQGRAVGCTIGRGAVEPRPSLRERRDAREGHRVAPGSQPDLLAPQRGRRHDPPPERARARRGRSRRRCRAARATHRPQPLPRLRRVDGRHRRRGPPQGGHRRTPREAR